MKTLILICISLFAETLFAQTVWEWQNPLPQGNTLNCIQSPSLQVGYACGQAGAFLKTTTAGKSWQLMAFPLRIDCTSMDFMDTLNGWVAGTSDGSAYVFQTPDGGNTWTQWFRQSASVASVFFLDKNTGWVSIDSTLFSSDDGGIHWASRSFSQLISSVFFWNRNIGWLTAGNFVYRTSDGGVTWQDTAIGNQYIFRLNKVEFVDSLDGYLIGSSVGPNEFSGSLFGSTDGGATWSQQLSVGVPLANYRTFTDINFAGRDLGWTVGGGEVFKTHDGKTWDSISTVPNLTGLTVVDSSTLWGAGQNGTLYVSTDGGEHWSNSYTGYITETNDLQVLNDRDIFAAGGETILKSSDGGVHWQAMTTGNFGEGYFDIQSVCFTDSLHGWIGVENLGGWGGVYATTDGGLTWSNQVDSIIRVFDIYFLNGKMGWFFSGGNSYTTSDSGRTWIAQSGIMPNAEIETVRFVSSEVGFAGGYLGLYNTTDGGNNWTKINLNVADPFVKGIYFLNAQIGWATGYNGNSGLLIKTTDGGSNWSVVSLPQVSYTVWPQSVFFTSENDGWIVGSGDSGFALYTSDGGSSWQAISLPSNSDLNRVVFANDTSGWILGSNGVILHTVQVGNTFVDDQKEFPPTNFGLSQNYPNPFNPSSVIQFEVPRSRFVSLKVYDVLGREVKTLVSEVEQPGIYEVKFDASGLPSGVYFYRLRAGSYSQTRKMLVLK